MSEKVQNLPEADKMTQKFSKRVPILANSDQNGLSLTIKDINALIKTCRKNNVLTLKFEGLELTMVGSGQKEVEVEDDGFVTVYPDLDDDKIVEVEEKDQEKLITEQLIEEHSQLNINDPEAFESQIRDSLLEKSKENEYS